MIRRLVGGFAATIVMAGLAACSTGTQSQPATPTGVTNATAPATTVDTFAGTWGQDDPINPGDPIVAATATAGSCANVEFRVSRDADGKTAAIVFAATCAQVRLRGEGNGTIAGDTLYWKAAGTAALEGGRQCGFRFLEGNKATPAGEGLIKVVYNGTVCDHAVSGTATVRRK